MIIKISDICGIETWVLEKGALYNGDPADGEIASDAEIEHLFTGQVFDKESKLYYYNARYYDATVGMFITPDPMMSGLNHYAYASCNPVMYSDPTGLSGDGDKKTDDQLEKEKQERDNKRTEEFNKLLEKAKKDAEEQKKQEEKQNKEKDQSKKDDKQQTHKESKDSKPKDDPVDDDKKGSNDGGEKINKTIDDVVKVFLSDETLKTLKDGFSVKIQGEKKTDLRVGPWDFNFKLDVGKLIGKGKLREEITLDVDDKNINTKFLSEKSFGPLTITGSKNSLKISLPLLSNKAKAYVQFSDWKMFIGVESYFKDNFFINFSYSANPNEYAFYALGAAAYGYIMITTPVINYMKPSYSIFIGGRIES